MAKGKGGFIGQDGLNAPNEPTGVSAAAGAEQASVSFTAPSDVGGSPITGYRAQSNDGIGASGSSSPITVTGLTAGTSYTFNVWAINAFGYSAPSDSSNSVTAGSPRAIFYGTNTLANNISYVNISSLGNTADFGDQTISRQNQMGCASGTRSVCGGGFEDLVYVLTNVIDYITISTTGNATDFGDLTQATDSGASAANSTRGLFMGGLAPSAISGVGYITIATTGNAASFGNLSTTFQGNTACASPTRALNWGGVPAGGGYSNIIEYFTIATTGNSTDFGDMTLGRYRGGAVASSTRGVYGGGDTGTGQNIIEYVTIASTGNATDFGDLLVSTRSFISGACSNVRGLFASQYQTTTADPSIQYITIASTGNAADFGDLTGIAGLSSQSSGTSNAHGGLQ